MQDEIFYARVFALVALAALGALLVALLRPFVGPIFWAGLLAFLFAPINVRLRKRFRDRRGYAALVITITVIVGIALPAGLLAATFVTQASELVKRLAELRNGESLRDWPVVQGLTRWIESYLSVPADRLFSWIASNLSSFLSFLLSQGGAILVGVVGTGAGVALMLFILFFALRDGDAAAARVIALVPMRQDRKKSLVNQMATVTRATVLGALVTAMVQGFLVGLSFLFASLPSPVVFGVLAAFTSLIPVGGTALVWGPAAIALAAGGRWGAAAFVASWGFVVVSSSDNIVRPMFVSGRAQVPTLAVFLGVLGGVPAFGLLGAFVGPILIALALALVRFAEEEKGLRAPPG